MSAYSVSDRDSWTEQRPDKPLVVKVHYDGVNKRITFSSSRSCTFDILRHKVCPVFCLSHMRSGIMGMQNLTMWFLAFRLNNVMPCLRRATLLPIQMTTEKPLTSLPMPISPKLFVTSMRVQMSPYPLLHLFCLDEVSDGGRSH